MTTQEQREDRELDLGRAFRAVRDRYDGTSGESEATLRRALLATRMQSRRRRITRWVVLPIAATLAASTAWAGVTGRLAPALSSISDVFHAEHAPPAPPPALPPSVAHVAPPASVAPVEPPPVETAAAEETAPAETTPAPEPPKPRAAVSAPPSPPPPRATASAPDPHATLFEEAHRLHFQDHDPARALVAWDRYLAAAPNGRFAPEARYNRALTLIRLGRHAEAKPALEAFANGTYGEYRRSEAKALLEALARDH